MIDTHSHIDLPIFADDFQSVIDHARYNGVTAQIIPGVIRAGWNRILQLASQETDLFAAIGLHPMYLAHHRQNDLELLRETALGGKLVAIGEIGLDYYVKDVSRSAQQELFEAQLAIAADAGLPVLLHVRKAHDQVQATIRRKKFKSGGIIHAFSGSLQQAENYIKLGFMISICGTITYDRATKIRSVAAQLPGDMLVVETDSPDIPPSSHHGKRNCPGYLGEIISSLAGIRSTPEDQLVKQLCRNTREILQLPGCSSKLKMDLHTP